MSGCRVNQSSSSLTSSDWFLPRWWHSCPAPSCAGGKGTAAAWSRAGRTRAWAHLWCCPAPLPSLLPLRTPCWCSCHPGCACPWAGQSSPWVGRGGTCRCPGMSSSPGTWCRLQRSWSSWHRRQTAPLQAAGGRKIQRNFKLKLK